MNNSRTCITISKVGKALSKISFVFSIVLFVCCVSCYFIFSRVYDFEIWSHGICMTVSEYFYNLSNNTMTFHTLIANMAIYSLIALVEIIVSRLCYNYFTYLYEVNDFYTKNGNMKLFIISIVQIVLSTLASLSVLEIIKKMNSMWDDVANLVYNPVGPITFGIVVLIIAIIFEVKTNKQLKKENN